MILEVVGRRKRHVAADAVKHVQCFVVMRQAFQCLGLCQLCLDQALGITHLPCQAYADAGIDQC